MGQLLALPDELCRIHLIPRIEGARGGTAKSNRNRALTGVVTECEFALYFKVFYGPIHVLNAGFLASYGEIISVPYRFAREALWVEECNPHSATTMPESARSVAQRWNHAPAALAHGATCYALGVQDSSYYATCSAAELLCPCRGLTEYISLEDYGVKPSADRRAQKRNMCTSQSCM